MGSGMSIDLFFKDCQKWYFRITKEMKSTQGKSFSIFEKLHQDSRLTDLFPLNICSNMMTTIAFLCTSSTYLWALAFVPTDSDRQ